MPISSFDEAITLAARRGPRRVAVAAAGDRMVITALGQAMRLGLVSPVMVGDAKDIHELAGQDEAWSGRSLRVIDCPDPREAARLAAEMTGRGEADMITVHAALRREHLPLVAASHRLIPMTSKGGGIVSAFMRCKGSENPYYEEFDRLLEAFASYGVTLSLGTSLRPASVCDGYDELSAAELETMAELASRALAAGVNVMIEGLGHATIGRIPEEVRRGKAACHGIPYRVLPMCTDIALGYDHIAGAIAGAVAVGAGADAITCMTRAEHLGLPTVDEVREAVIATRVAAHAGELVKIGDFSRDRQMSRTRWEHGCKGDWTAAVYPEGAREALVARGRLEDQQIRCSMCGNHCGIGGGIDSVGQAAALGARK